MNVLMNVFRNNIAEIGTPVCTGHTSNTITIEGSIRWYKDGATWGFAYRAKGGTNWVHESAGSSQDFILTKAGLSAGTTYDIKLYVKYQGVYQYGPSIEASTDALSNT